MKFASPLKIIAFAILFSIGLMCLPSGSTAHSAIGNPNVSMTTRPRRAAKPEKNSGRTSWNSLTRKNVAPLVPAPGALSFSTTQYNVREDAGSANITLQRTGGTDNTVVAKVTASDISTSVADTLFRPGTVDLSFNGPFGTSAMALQPDGKLIVGTARLNADGSVDNSFNMGSGGSGFRTITLQPDGKAIIGGTGTLFRLNSNGSADNTFTPGISLNPNDGTADPSPRIRATALQADGKILVGGIFYIQHEIKGLARLNSDGSLDNTFPAREADVFAIAVQPDGKIIVEGNLVEGDVRLNSNGSVDGTFNSGGINNVVRSIALQADGKIIVGGDFTKVGGVTRNGIARLNADGSLDGSFNPGTGVTGSSISGVHTTALQPDGKVIIGGDFAFVNGTARNYLARLNADGTLDMTFDPGPGANNAVSASALQPDGKVIVGGNFTMIGGFTRNGIARLNGDLLVTWAAGDATDKTISLPIIDDAVVEADESLGLTLTPVSGGASLGTNASATLTIVDNDTAVSSVSASGAYNGTATLTATLMSGNGGLGGKNISFMLNGQSAGTAITDASGIATLSGVSLAGINAGSYPAAVTASFAGDSSYAASSANGSLVVAKASQTILVTTHAPAAAAFNSQFTVAANASSGLAVDYSASGNCTHTGAAFTMTSGSGTCTVTYNQGGNSNYNPAGQLTETVNAQKAAQTITITNNAPAAATYSSQFTVTATASSGLAVVYSGTGSCTNSGGLFTMTAGVGTCTVKYDQPGDGNYNAASPLTQIVNAQKINQTISFNALPDKVIGDADFALNATTDAVGLNISYAATGQCTVSGSIVHLTATGSCSVTASQAGNNNYEPANPVTRTFNIVAPITLVLDASGPNPNQAAAVDSIAFLRDPFPVVSELAFISQSADRNTRVILFVANLPLPISAAAVVVNLTGNNNQSYDLVAEDVRAVPDSSLAQVTFRLPDDLVPGVSILKIKALNQTSNSGVIRIRAAQ